MSPTDYLPTALAALIDATGAERGFLDLRTSGEGPEAQRFFASRGIDASAEARARAIVSSGIVAEALQSGTVVLTADAVSDERFSARESVQEHRIRAVLCAPLGDPALGGFVYLDRPRPFEPDATPRTEGWIEAVTPLVRRLGAIREATADPTAAARAVLDCEELVGRSEAMARMLDEVSLVRLSRAPVLITGPTGAGKSTVARVVHRNSRQSEGAFEAYNAATISGDLASATLFGVAPGAATQVRSRDGAIASANGGTLFLDEIAMLPLDAQAQLLTFLDQGTYRRVGDDRERTANVRLLAATNESLPELVREGRFREDLLFRLDVLRIRVPSLAERPEDVGALAQALLTRLASDEDLSVSGVDEGAVHWLAGQTWPGQVRQLRGELHRGMLRAAAEGVPRIERRHLRGDGASPDDDGPQDFHGAVEDFQRTFLRQALLRQGGNRSATAKAIGLSRSRLYELIRTLGL